MLEHDSIVLKYIDIQRPSGCLLLQRKEVSPHGIIR